MCFVITIERLFRAMTQQSILHLVVNWKVFAINICCFIAKIYISNLRLHLFGLLIMLGLRSGGQILIY